MMFCFLFLDSFSVFALWRALSRNAHLCSNNAILENSCCRWTVHGRRRPLRLLIVCVSFYTLIKNLPDCFSWKNWICSSCQHWLGTAFPPAHQRSMIFITTKLCRSLNWNFWQCYFSILPCTHVNGISQALVAYLLSFCFFPVTSFLPVVIAGIVFVPFCLFPRGILTGPWLWLLLTTDTERVPLSKRTEPIISTVLMCEDAGKCGLAFSWHTNKWLPLFTDMKPSLHFPSCDTVPECTSLHLMAKNHLMMGFMDLTRFTAEWHAVLHRVAKSTWTPDHHTCISCNLDKT